MTANIFGIALSTASKIIHEVCKAITEHFGSKYICLPRMEEEMIQKASEFESKYGMMQAIGCIDGTHVPILRPIENSLGYYFYKMFFSLTVQAVCDYRGVFMDVDRRWPGSVHNAKVFCNSRINKNVRNGKLPMTQQILPGPQKIGNYRIGDPAYPLTPYCLGEYSTFSSNAEVIFSNMLRSSRNLIECAFGRLKARWGFLTRMIDLQLEHVPVVIFSCFVLHNFCELNQCYVDPDRVQKQAELHKQHEKEFKNIPDPVYSVTLEEGKAVRKVLTKYI